MHIILILFGIVIIIIAIYLVYNIKDKETEIYDDIIKKHDEIVEYSNIMNDIVNNLDTLIDNTFSKIDNNEENNNDKGDLFYDNYNLYNKNEVSEIRIDKDYIENNNKNKNTNQNNNEKNKSNIENKIELEIYKLYNNGLSSHEIARELKKGIREVEIILKLIKNK